MPEGPSILIHTETLAPLLEGEKIVSAAGNAKIDMDLVTGKKIISVTSWGKHLLICLPEQVIRIHFLLFGSMSVNEHIKPDRSLRLKLSTKKTVVYFYTCAIRLLPGDADEIYDWEADVMNARWNPAKARKKLKKIPTTMVCDALLNQDIFAGVGNIIKNEVLYRIRLHPETLIQDVPPRRLSRLVKETRNYCFDFLRWKKAFVLRKNWLAHTKKICSRCKIPLQKKYCGHTQRRTFFCDVCQLLYP